MDYLSFMRTAARKAGVMLTSSTADTHSEQKTAVTDFVTVADIKTQDLLRKYLGEVLPDVVLLSEEDPEDKRRAMYEPDFTGFVVDPIDGTYNFKRGMQESAISIGYIKNGEPVAGVIYDPFKDELFEAEVGKGAHLNDQPIHVSDQKSLDGASVATSNGYEYAAAARSLERQIAVYTATGIMPWTSCPGSAVLVLAWIAAGRIDAIHHTGFKPWDNAAGLLIVREAGGFAHTLQGKEAKFTDACLLVASPVVGKALAEIFSTLSPEQLS